MPLRPNLQAKCSKKAQAQVLSVAVHGIQTLVHLTGAVHIHALDLQSHVLVLCIEQLSIGCVKSESVAAVAVQQHARSFAGSAVTVTLRKVEEVGRRTLCGVIAHDRGLWWCGSSHHLMARWLCLTRRGHVAHAALRWSFQNLSAKKCPLLWAYQRKKHASNS